MDEIFYVDGEVFRILQKRLSVEFVFINNGDHVRAKNIDHILSGLTPFLLTVV